MSIQSTLNPADPHGTSLLTLKNNAMVRATDIYVGESGTIKGNGPLDGNVTLLGGTLSPGLSPGQITITGDLTMNSGKIVIEIAGLGPGQFDVVDVGGTANLLAGTIEFDFINGFAPQAGDQIDFLSAASVLLGTGVAFTYNGLAPGFEFDVDPTTGGLVFTAINNGVSMPEPSALAVLAASLAGFWLVQARRIRRRSVAAI